MRVYNRDEFGKVIWEQIISANASHKKTTGYPPEYLEVTKEEYKALVAYIATRKFTHFELNLDVDGVFILGMKLLIKD